MFKKGQLVKSPSGKYYVIELKSILFPGEYLATRKKGGVITSTYRLREDEITLIGNNFKLKG